MAHIRKTKYGTFEVQWRIAGRYKSKSFKTKNEAKKFALTVDLKLDEPQENISFEEASKLYEEKFSLAKKSWRSELVRLRMFRALPFASKNIGSVNREDVEEFIENRKNDSGARSGSKISPSTIVKDLHLMSAIFNFAIREGWTKTNPCRGLSNKPKEAPHRERVASDEDKEKLLIASGWDGASTPLNDCQMVIAAFFFACYTGMRAGEIMALEESWMEGNVIHLPKEKSKTGAKRDIAVCSRAMEILEAVKKAGRRPQYWGLPGPSRDALWRKIRDRAGLGAVTDSHGNVIKEGLNFHDSRATFCTWAAGINPATGAPRLDILALSRQTGHKDLQMLQRYYRPKAEAIAKILDNVD